MSELDRSMRVKTQGWREKTRVRNKVVSRSENEALSGDLVFVPGRGRTSDRGIAP